MGTTLSPVTASKLQEGQAKINFSLADNFGKHRF
jgi:hypothetical protein